MLRRPGILITGASGEIGHGLISRLAQDRSTPIVTLDVRHLEPDLGKMVHREIIGSITDPAALDRILAEFDIDHVYHLAAYLSTRSEFTPVTAHEVNVEGTMNLLEFAQKQGESHGRPVVFLYPSSIAAYGLPDLETKAKAGKVREEEFNTPTTMYGCNKLYCELLGRYYARHYKQLSAEPLSGKVDFRAVRFPGLISAVTVPSGGTSDYAPEMIHAAARGEAYACSSVPTRASRSWRCPTAWRSCSGSRQRLAPTSRRRPTTWARSIRRPKRSGRLCSRASRAPTSPTRTT